MEPYSEPPVNIPFANVDEIKQSPNGDRSFTHVLSDKQRAALLDSRIADKQWAINDSQAMLKSHELDPSVLNTLSAESHRQNIAAATAKLETLRAEREQIVVTDDDPLPGEDYYTALAAKQEQPEKEPPRPLRRDLPPAEPFPLGALGTLGGVVGSLAKIIQAPEALCAQSVLAAVTLAVQPYRNILIDGRVIPLSENYITIGESGERKSAVDKEVLRPHKTFEKKGFDTLGVKKLDFLNDLESYQKAREVALRKAKTREDKKAALDVMGPPPVAPLSPMFTMEEPTYEGIVKLLQEGMPSVGLFSDEGGRMLGGYAMSESQELKTICGLSGLWDGKPISRVRGGDGAMLLYGRRFSMHLMTQPQIATRLLADPIVLQQGYLSRCLICWPASTAGTRKYKALSLRDDEEMLAYEARITAILDTKLPLVEGKVNELDPPYLTLSEDAKALWTKFHNFIEKQIGENQRFAPIKGFANKAAEHALRLAAPLTLYLNIHAPNIDAEQMGWGIKLAQYYLSEALRLFQIGLTDPDLELAGKLLTWAQAKPPNSDEHIFVSIVDMYQRGLNAISDAPTARRLAKILEAHGWFVPVPGGMKIDGLFRREVWEVVRGQSI